MRSTELINHITERITNFVGDAKSLPMDQLFLVRIISEILILQTQCLAAIIEEKNNDVVKLSREMSMLSQNAHKNSQAISLLTKNVINVAFAVLPKTEDKKDV